jgi:ABC-type phosphate/phosphonate transport system substrate-binding protein
VLLAKPETRGGPSYQGLILTRADSRIRSLADLKGKTFCYVNKGSTSGYLYPRALLRQAGVDPDTDFASKSFGHDHLNTLRLLDRGECQGAAVYAKILETGSKHGMPSERFHQLASTERIPYDAYSVLAKTPPEEVAAIQSALLALDRRASWRGASSRRRTPTSSASRARSTPTTTRAPHRAVPLGRGRRREVATRRTRFRRGRTVRG